MRTKIVAAAFLALGTLVALPAFADKGGGGGDANFPMPAATFKQHVEARRAKMKQHIEERAAKLNAEEAKELRAKFAAASAKVDAEVAKAVADGTVTKDEAKAVRAAAGHAGGGGHCEKGDKSKKS
jgi:hypothetical protein